mgnify:CR=1 FL=1
MNFSGRDKISNSDKRTDEYVTQKDMLFGAKAKEFTRTCSVPKGVFLLSTLKYLVGERTFVKHEIKKCSNRI